jgi:hypothetical protein
VCHVGYIIGFPNDTYERVMEDVRALRDTLLVDQASFFMLTPLPGSRDHQNAVRAGVPLDPDYNNFDSFHATVPHPKMSGDEWRRAFRDAWREFYSFEQMRRSLLRQNPHTYWALVKNLIWYRAAMAEGAHPMITGFFRLKHRTSRRPGLPIEGRWTFFKRRVREHAYIVREYVKICLEMQELWLKTRIRHEEYAFLGDLRERARRSTADVKLEWGRVHAAIAERLGALGASVGAHVQLVGTTMAGRIDEVRASLKPLAAADPFGNRTAIRRAIEGLDLFSLRRMDAHRDHLKEYWQQVWHACRRFRFWKISPIALALNFVRDTRQAVLFFYAMLLERADMRCVRSSGRHATVSTMRMIVTAGAREPMCRAVSPGALRPGLRVPAECPRHGRRLGIGRDTTSAALWLRR